MSKGASEDSTQFFLPIRRVFGVFGVLCRAPLFLLLEYLEVKFQRGNKANRTNHHFFQSVHDFCEFALYLNALGSRVKWDVHLAKSDVQNHYIKKDQKKMCPEALWQSLASPYAPIIEFRSLGCYVLIVFDFGFFFF